MNRRELVLGHEGRSGQQWDIWEAVYSPVGPDGYPKRIWDKLTGVIDQEVAALLAGALRPVAHPASATGRRLGKKLAGKLHIYVGDMDNYYLNNAVYLVEDFLKTTTNPYVRRRGGLRRPRRALLERRPHAAERLLAAALPPDVRPQDRGADAEDGPARGGRDELAILKISHATTTQMRRAMMRHTIPALMLALLPMAITCPGSRPGRAGPRRGGGGGRHAPRIRSG